MHEPLSELNFSFRATPEIYTFNMEATSEQSSFYEESLWSQVHLILVPLSSVAKFISR